MGALAWAGVATGTVLVLAIMAVVIFALLAWFAELVMAGRIIPRAWWGTLFALLGLGSGLFYFWYWLVLTQ